MAVKLDFCKRGHDTNLPGSRYKNGSCVLCKKITTALYSQTDRGKEINRTKEKRFLSTAKGKIYKKNKDARYRKTLNGQIVKKHSQAKYESTENGKYYRMKKDLRRRMRNKSFKIAELELRLMELLNA